MNLTVAREVFDQVERRFQSSLTGVAEDAEAKTAEQVTTSTAA
jgi:hypothetical protein